MPHHSGQSRFSLLVLELELKLQLQLVLALSLPVLARVGLRAWVRLEAQVSVQGPPRWSLVPLASRPVLVLQKRLALAWQPMLPQPF